LLHAPTPIYFLNFNTKTLAFCANNRLEGTLYIYFRPASLYFNFVFRVNGTIFKFS